MNDVDYGLCRIYWGYPQKIPERVGGYQEISPEKGEKKCKCSDCKCKKEGKHRMG